MTYLSAVLGSPAVAETVEVLAAARDREVSSIVLAEDGQQLGNVPEACIAMLTTRGSADLQGYRLDIAIRLCHSSGAIALILPTELVGGLPSTARSLASRADIWLLRIEPRTPLAAVIVAIDRAIQGQCAEALDRLDRLFAVLEHNCGTDNDRFLNRVSAAYGSRFEQGGGAKDSVSASVPLTGSVAKEEVTVAVPAGRDRSSLIGAKLAALLVASALARTVEASRRADAAPLLSKAEVLTELLAGPNGDTASLLRRARTLGIPVDSWHIAARVELESGTEPKSAAGEVDAFETRQVIMRAALDHVRSRGGDWYLGRSGQAFVLVRIYRSDRGRHAISDVVCIANGLIAALSSRFPGVEIRCGIGGVHNGPPGLASTAMEAQASLVAGRAAGAAEKVYAFDHAGLRRTLVEWYASNTARDAVRTVLQPLDSLGPAKRDSFILTLKTFLDCQGSLSKTGTIIHLHRNAVSYRINRIFEMLDVDPDNPDDRLLLQLACRARVLS